MPCNVQVTRKDLTRREKTAMPFLYAVNFFIQFTRPFVILRQDGIHLWPLKAFLNVVVIYQLKLCPMYFRQKLRGFFATLWANIGHRFYPICHFQMKSNLADSYTFFGWILFPPILLGTLQLVQCQTIEPSRTRSGINGLALICHKTTSIKGPLWFGWKMTLFQGYFCQCCS